MTIEEKKYDEEIKENIIIPSIIESLESSKIIKVMQEEKCLGVTKISLHSNLSLLRKEMDLDG